MDMTFTFPGGKRVDGRGGGFIVRTDQPPERSAPSPFGLFLASIGACAAYYVLEFCQARDIPTSGIAVHERTVADTDGHVTDVHLDVELPATFPLRYIDAVVRATDQCTVRKHLARPPSIRVAAGIVTAA